MVDDRGNRVPDPADPTQIRPASEQPTQLTRAAGRPPADEPTQPHPAPGHTGTDPWEGQEDDLAPTGGHEVTGGAETQLIPPVDGRPDATSIMPPASEDPRWSARAEVPTRPRGATPPAQWDGYQDPHGGRAWWLPILLGVVGLVLLAAVGVGAYLIKTNNDDKDTDPTPTATRPTATGPATSAAPTPSATSASPSASPSPSFPALQNLRGKTQAEAVAYLDQNDIAYVIQFRETAEVAPGTVVDTDPLPDALITPGTIVKVVVAKAPPTPTAVDSSPTATPTT